MSTPIIYKGSDEVINVTITDADGVAIPISDLSEVVVSVYQTKEEIIQQWLLSEGSLLVVNDSAGIVQANLELDNTIEIPLKRLFMEVVVEISDTNFETNTQRMIVSDIVLADLKNSVV